MAAEIRPEVKPVNKRQMCRLRTLYFESCRRFKGARSPHRRRHRPRRIRLRTGASNLVPKLPCRWWKLTPKSSASVSPPTWRRILRLSEEGRACSPSSVKIQLPINCADSSPHRRAFLPEHLIVDASRPTTRKLRVMVQNHHIVRVDYEHRQFLSVDGGRRQNHRGSGSSSSRKFQRDHHSGLRKRSRDQRTHGPRNCSARSQGRKKDSRRSDTARLRSKPTKASTS